MPEKKIRDACVDCAMSLVCESGPAFGELLAVICRDHRVAFSNVTPAQAKHLNQVGKDPGFHWMDHTTFSQTWGVPCPCILCRPCPLFIETHNITDEDGSIRVHFEVKMDEPVDRLRLEIYPFEKK
jgi:hypothetical protein